MSTEKCCKNCRHSTVKDHSLYCLKMDGEYLQRVNGKACCNHFSEKTTLKNSGYTEGNDGCFLTSACVDYLGKADDCYELMTLRRFRDTYVKNTEKGEELVQQYYSIAPKIVEAINKSGAAEEYYKRIYESILLCISHIEKNECEAALRIYTKMVTVFKEKLGV